MKKKFYSFAKIAGVLLACAVLVACGGGGETTAAPTSALQSNYATVSTQTVAGKTATTSDGTSIAFNSTGTGGTISFSSAKVSVGSGETAEIFDSIKAFAAKTNSASNDSEPLFDTNDSLTFTYDGDVMTFPSMGVRLYMRGASGRYYLFPGQLRNSTGSGVFGKWVWKEGTTPVTGNFYFYDYYWLISPNIFQNPVFEANNDTSYTFEITNGVMYLYHNGQLNTEEYCLYDETYLYPIVWSWTF